MNTITAIEVQKKKKNRYNIFVNDTFKFGVSEDTLIKFRLHKGMVLTDDLEHEILSHNDYQRVYLKGIQYLSYGLRTEKEVYDKLLSLEDVHIPLIENAINQLKKEKYINDTFYVKAFIQNTLATTKKGKHAIIQTLQKKGIDTQLIDEGIEQYYSPDELDTAISVASKYIQKQKKMSKKVLLEKTTQHLVQKGYTYAVAKEAVSHVDIAVSKEDELEALYEHANTLYKRYAKSYNGYILKQKLSNALYQKGFSYDDIRAYINDKMENEDDRFIER
ncbi:recombination regulator RecX [Carnobacteriaceae bacterium zg-ZUI78]|nr:recombination regulator RecX [Carnobacteriaceae bacterium zg-ZUI78]